LRIVRHCVKLMNRDLAGPRVERPPGSSRGTTGTTPCERSSFTAWRSRRSHGAPESLPPASRALVIRGLLRLDRLADEARERLVERGIASGRLGPEIHLGLVHLDVWREAALVDGRSSSA
jgi:hypothetical protein